MSDDKKQIDLTPDEARRKELQKGEALLTKEEFGKDAEQYKNYQKAIEAAKAMAGSNKSLLKNVIKTLHQSASDYSKYLPGKPVQRAAARSKIPQLNKLNDLCSLAHKAFNGELAEVKAVQDYVKDLGFKGDMPEFTPYFKGLNAVKSYIKDEYEEVG